MDHDLDPEVSAQLVQTTSKRTEIKNRMPCLRTEGHWANDREYEMSSSRLSTQNRARTARMATRQRLHNRKVRRGYVSSSTSTVTIRIPLPDMKNTATFRDRAMEDNDEPWLEADHRTGWNRTFESGTYRGMLYGIVLRDYPKQVVSLAKAKSVPTNMREFLSWTQTQYRSDVTASTVERKAGAPASTRTCPGGCKDFSHKVSNAHSTRLTCKICTVRKEECHQQRQDPATCSHRHTDHRGSNAHTRKTYCID